MHDYLKDYVNDIMVKFQEAHIHVNNLRRVFKRCRKYKIRISSLKCAFGVSSGKFLEFTLHRERIDIAPTKIKVIQAMELP